MGNAAVQEDAGKPNFDEVKRGDQCPVKDCKGTMQLTGS